MKGSPKEGKTPSDALDPKWVQMCEGVRNNDQTALEELFELIRGMSCPPCLDDRDAEAGEGAPNGSTESPKPV
jgi:hypothetical protein